MSDRICIVNARAVLADGVLEQATLVIDKGLITAIGPASQVRVPADATVVDAQGGYLCPGYIDIHVHGADNFDFMDGTVQAVERVCIAHTRHGTTTIFPTTTTGSKNQIAAMLQSCGKVQADWSNARHAQIAGVHFYGPYFAPEKSGIHRPDAARLPDPSEYRPALDSGIVRVATCAAELPGAIAFYKAASRAGCLVTSGHSNASFNEMRAAFDAGMRHVDHLYCAMSNVASVRARLGTPMQASMLEFILMTPDMSTELIADGEHLAPDLMEFAFRMKGPDRLCLVTDANRAMDMPPGRYDFGPLGEGTGFVSDGRVARDGKGGLASSIMGMDHMVRTMVKQTSAKLHEAVRMASLTPARLTGIDRRVGSLEAGKEADVLLLDNDLFIKQVYIKGRAWQAQ